MATDLKISVSCLASISPIIKRGSTYLLTLLKEQTHSPQPSPQLSSLLDLHRESKDLSLEPFEVPTDPVLPHVGEDSVADVGTGQLCSLRVGRREGCDWGQVVTLHGW